MDERAVYKLTRLVMMCDVYSGLWQFDYNHDETTSLELGGGDHNDMVVMDLDNWAAGLI